VRWSRPAYEQGPGVGGVALGHERQKSLGDAIRTIKNRHGSVSQNAHEIADALKAPVSARLIVRGPPFPYVPQATPSPPQSPCERLQKADERDVS
jgi:hypothetical protein